MFTEKKCFIMIMFCFLATLLFFPLLGAQEPSEKTPSQLSASENTKENVPEGEQPQITVGEATYDVGDINEGETIFHSFTIKNTGTAELSIKDVKAG